MEKIILFTGSFNPITIAHRKLMLDALDFVKGDKGLFICTNDKYLTKKIVVDNKNIRPFLLSETVRKEMIESLSNTYSKLGYGGVELGGESPSTVKTFNSIMKKYPNDEFFYLFGADKLQGIPHWTNIDLLINKLSFLVYPRNGFDVESIIKNSPFLMKYHEKNPCSKTKPGHPWYFFDRS